MYALRTHMFSWLQTEDLLQQQNRALKRNANLRKLVAEMKSEDGGTIVTMNACKMWNVVLWLGSKTGAVCV